MKPKIRVDENGHRLMSLNEFVNDYLNGIPKTEDAIYEIIDASNKAETWKRVELIEPNQLPDKSVTHVPE